MLLHLLAVYGAANHHLLADTPNPGNPTAPPGVGNNLNTVLGWIKYLGLAAALIGVFLVGARMAVHHRTGVGGEHLAALGYVAGALVLMGGASAMVGFFAT